MGDCSLAPMLARSGRCLPSGTCTHPLRSVSLPSTRLLTHEHTPSGTGHRASAGLGPGRKGRGRASHSARLRRAARSAASVLRNERPGHTLTPTALVHEAYLRLVDQQIPPLEGRRHFYAIAARVMRQVLVDHARSRKAAKRNVGRAAVPLDEAPPVAIERGDELVALDDALSTLAGVDPGKAQLVELRYFTGLTIEETAEMLGVSAATVKREWALARAWLHREISGAP